MMISKRRGNDRSGFTLVEVLLCLSIICVLAGITVGPRFTSLLADIRLRAFVQDMVTDMQECRNRAVIETRGVEMQIRLSGYYLKYSDTLAVIKYVPWPSGWGIDTSHNDQNITFSYGTTGIMDPFGNDTVHLHDNRGVTRNIVVSAGGRIRVE